MTRAYHWGFDDLQSGPEDFEDYEDWMIGPSDAKAQGDAP